MISEQGRAKLSRLMKQRWAKRKGSRYFSPETRAKLAEAARRRWARTRTTTAKMESANNGNFNVVKYVPDDLVTTLVDVLRKLMPPDELASALSLIAHERITALSKGDS